MTLRIAPQRGHVYRVMIGPTAESAILCLVVSSNAHNAQESKYACVLVTSERNAPAGLPSWVRLASGDPAFGHIVCSHIDMIFPEELKEDLGSVSMETELKVNQALKRMLGL